MGRKEPSLRCGSKKIKIAANQKECKVCKYVWAGKLGGKTSKKESPILDEKIETTYSFAYFVSRTPAALSPDLEGVCPSLSGVPS